MSEIGIADNALETGQFALAASAISQNLSVVIPDTVAVSVSSIPTILGIYSSNFNSISAAVWIFSGLNPALANAKDKAIEHTHYLRIYIAQLRHKLEKDPSRPQMIITEPGVGYRLNALN